MEKTGEDKGIIYLFIIVAIFLAFILLVYLYNRVEGFYKELYYYNLEIGRTYGREKAYWLRKKRRLWCGLIPFANFIMDLKNKKNESNRKARYESKDTLKAELIEKLPDKPSNKQINSPEKKSEPKPKKRVFAKFINKIVQKLKKHNG